MVSDGGCMVVNHEFLSRWFLVVTYQKSWCWFLIQAQHRIIIHKYFPNSEFKISQFKSYNLFHQKQWHSRVLMHHVNRRLHASPAGTKMTCLPVQCTFDDGECPSSELIFLDLPQVLSRCVGLAPIQLFATSVFWWVVIHWVIFVSGDTRTAYGLNTFNILPGHFTRKSLTRESNFILFCC